MANIDLTNMYRRKSDKKSPVDSSIVLNKIATQNEVYSDLKLDLQFSDISERPLNAAPNSRDLEKIVNKESVLNAVKNVLNTRLNSRLLDPGLQMNFDSYLFDEISEVKAYLIVYELQNKIYYLEPRIFLEGMKIIVDYDNDAYQMVLSIAIPSLNESLTLRSEINSEGVFFA